MESGIKRKLSTEPYKGVRDFYPEDMFVHNYILETMRETAERFGYLEYSASVLEPAELYEAKTSQEIVSEQTYTFIDRGERRVTLRPEMTPSVARMLAGRRRELALPLRLYSIPNVFRYERPQRGRLREHWQLNCDLFGVFGIEAEIEIITLADRLMQAFGAKKNDYEIRVNSRTLLMNTYRSLLKDGSEFPELLRLLDRKDKMESDTFLSAWQERFGAPFKDVEATDHPPLKELTEALTERNVDITFDPFLARGFDYYTDIVFEVFDTAPDNRRSLFGGGRYDRLLEIFDAEPLPAVGFGMGDVTVRDFLTTHNLMPAYRPSTDLFLATFDTSYIGAAQELAEFLREKGLRVAVNLLDKKVGDQVKTADKLHIPFILVVGENEMKTQTFKLKHLATTDEREVPREEIAPTIQKRIGA
jgi:histidyl-tRNA synthetase